MLCRVTESARQSLKSARQRLCRARLHGKDRMATIGTANVPLPCAPMKMHGKDFAVRLASLHGTEKQLTPSRVGRRSPLGYFAVHPHTAKALSFAVHRHTAKALSFAVQPRTAKALCFAVRPHSAVRLSLPCAVPLPCASLCCVLFAM
jgi:hypothetical protein